MIRVCEVALVLTTVRRRVQRLPTLMKKGISRDARYNAHCAFCLSGCLRTTPWLGLVTLLRRPTPYDGLDASESAR